MELNSKNIWHVSYESAWQFGTDLLSIIERPDIKLKITTTALGFLLRPLRTFKVTESETELVENIFYAEEVHLDLEHGTADIIARKPTVFESIT
jgi:hypothetical protein